MIQGSVKAVCLDDKHNFSKKAQDKINVIEGLGVEGDSHFGKLAQHRYLQAQDPTQPNLRQVHLLDSELLDDLKSFGHHLNPGDMGENITTRGINLVKLPLGTLLHLGETVTLRVTGLRNPCPLIEKYKTDLFKVFRDDIEIADNEVGYKIVEGTLKKKAGIMSVVLTTGPITSNDTITVELPPRPYKEPPFL